MLKDRQIKLVVGSLLHDIGKVVYRSGDGRNHSVSGYDFLNNQAKIEDPEILNCVRYHHGKYLSSADIAPDDLAYITYYADNVAAFTDRREASVQEEGFDKSIPLDSVFNILNGNHGKSHYAMQVLNPKEAINYPTEEAVSMDEHFYKTVVDNITNNLLGIKLDEEYVNSLLSVLEANLSYIPSSTSKRELADISLFAFGQLFQTDCVWIIIGTYLIVLVHPVNIFFYIFSHLLIGQRNCLCSFHSATYGFFQIELCHCRYRAGHTQQYNCQFHQSLFHFHVSC